MQYFIYNSASDTSTTIIYITSGTVDQDFIQIGNLDLDVEGDYVGMRFSRDSYDMKDLELFIDTL